MSVSQNDSQEEIRMLYQDAIDNIRHIKRREWSVLLLHTAITYASWIAYSMAPSKHLIVLLCVSTAFGVYFMIWHHIWHIKEQKRLSYIYQNHFSSEFIKAREAYKKPNFRNARHNLSLKVAQILMLFIQLLLFLLNLDS